MALLLGCHYMRSAFWCSYSTYIVCFTRHPGFQTLICTLNIAKACEDDTESFMNAAWVMLRPEYVFNFKGFKVIIPVINMEIFDIA